MAWAPLALAPGLAWAEPVVLEGTLDGIESSFAYLPFDVPAGTREIEIEHDDLSTKNILDWGLDDPRGFRGWGGGNDEHAIVGEGASSRSYLAGPIVPGEWRVVIGLAKIVERPLRYRVVIHLRDTPTLTDDATLKAYAPSAPLSTGSRWYAGDLHVHSRESGDAHPSLDEVAIYARERGLDFVELSEHNTTSQLWRMADAQARHQALLFIPGVEFTTYAGHANGIGATAWVSHRLGPDVTIEQAGQAFATQGAVLSINHPVLDLGNLCIGCAWKQAVPAQTGAIEIGTGPWSSAGKLFDEQAMAYWDSRCNEGLRLAAVGGSDDHRAGEDDGPFPTKIGSPTTLVFARELSVGAIVDGIRAGRTVVKLEGPDDPMIDLTLDGQGIGSDVLATAPVVAHVHVTGGVGREVRFVLDGEPEPATAVTSDPFDASMTITPTPGRTGRVRAEVLVDGHPRTVTSHVWFGFGQRSEGSCGGCASGGAGLFATLLGLLGWRKRNAAR